MTMTMAQADDRLAQLYDEHAAAVLAYARRRVPHAAEDILSETFVVAWRRIDDVPSGAQRLWLLGVARRVLANVVRGERRREALGARVLAEGAGVHDDGVGHGPDVDLVAAVAALPDRQREVVQLVFWDDLSPAEAATVLGTTSLVVRSRLHRALRTLRRSVGGAEPVASVPSPLPSGGTHAAR